MKIQVDRDVLAEAVSFAVRLLPAKSTLPILGGVLIETGQDGISISSFDYEVSTTTTLAATVEEPGKVVVIGRLLADIASRLPNAPVVITERDNRVSITCGSSEFTLLSMSIDEYPTIPTVTGKSGVVKAADFADAVSQVAMAASRDDVMPVITGILFEVSDKHINLVATDRFRVAIREIEWDSDSISEMTSLVPARTVSELSKTFANAGTITISFSDVSDREIIAFSADNKTVTSHLLKGTFPPVKKLFPDAVPHHAVVNTAELIEATRRVKLVVDREGFMKCTFSQNVLTLESVSGEQAQAHEEVDAIVSLDEAVLSLKTDFLLDGLAAVHSEFTRISFIAGETATKPGPILLTSQTSKESASSEAFRYLLQPKLLLR